MAIVLDHLEGGSTTGGNVAEASLVAKLLDRGSGIATTANGEGLAFEIFDSFADGFGAGLEFFLFEDAHWTVPEDHLRGEDGFLIEFHGLRTDIDALEAFWDIAFDDFDHTAFDRFKGIGDDGVDWKEDF